MYLNNKERSKIANERFSKEYLLRSLLSIDVPIIVDAGANVGQSVDYFKSIWTDAIIHSFEPVEESYKQLTDNIQKYSNVHCYNYALSNINGKAEFYVNNHQNMLSSFYNLNKNSTDSIAVNCPEPDHKNFFDYNIKTVNVTTLDNFASLHNIKYIDILKMDVQGAEPLILEGATNILESTNIIITELMLYDLYEKKLNFYDYEKILLPLGFELYDISHQSKNPYNGRTDWVEVIYKKNT